MTKKEIIEKIRKLKDERFGDAGIECRFNNISYSLLPLTSDSVDDNGIINLLSVWRRKYEKWYPSQFKITNERTKKWLQSRVIDEKDRMLFMIKVNEKYLGHIGLYRPDFEKLTFDIDNTIRGEDLYPGIMTDAILNLMKWGMKTFKLKGYTFHTASDNDRVLRLCKRLGFFETERIPLVRIKKDEGYFWEDAPKNNKGKIIRYNVVMERYEK